MHRSGNLLFVGKDEMGSYGPDESSASSEILKQTLSGVHSPKVIWIGTELAGDDLTGNHSTYQPSFHTDLFFCPLGFNDIAGKQKFCFIFAMPERQWMWPKIPTDIPLPKTVETLFKRFVETKNGIEHQLQNANIDFHSIEVPLPIEFRYSVEDGTSINWEFIDQSKTIHVYQIWAFANGLVNETQGKREFWMPKYKARSKAGFLKNATTRAIVAVSRVVTVKPIEGHQYQPQKREALRCKVKVLVRD
jgi:hypothetical protein